MAAVLFAGSMMASVGNLYYTLEISQTAAAAGGNTSYDGSAEMTVGGMTWSLPGNTDLGDFWAIGGKSLTSKERATYSQTAMGDAIAKIVVSHSGTTSDALLVDSVVLTVASDKDFNNVIDRKKENPTISKNVAGTIEFLAAESWAKDAYYKVSFFLTNAKTKNYRLPINKIDFYSYQSATAPAINAEKIALGLIPTTTLPYEKTVELAVVGANLSDAITYSVLGENTTVTGTLTTEGGTLNVKFAAAAEGEYSDTIVLTSGATTTKVAVEADIVKTTGDGTKANPFNVADVVKLNNEYSAEKYWVVGYIVGCAANGGLIGTDAVSNIALGDAADQTENVIPVELPSGDIRTALNLVDNTTNKGKKVKVFGQLVSYFTYFGVKAISEFEFVEETVEHTYTLVGPLSPAGWDQTSAAGDMTLNDGVYTFKIEDVTLTAGTQYEYKIVEDHSWAVSFPQSGNASFSVEKSGKYDVTFTLDATTKAYAANAVLKEEIAVNKTFVVLGGFNGWSAEAVEVAADAETAKFVVSIAEAADIEFKVKVNDAWLSNGQTYNRDNTGAEGITSNGDNMKLQADVAGEYTFTWTFATNALEITYPEVSTDCDWDAIAWLGDGFGGGAYTEQFKVCAAEGQAVVNIQKPGWAADGGIYTNFPAAISTVSLAEGQYAIDGAGVVLYLTAFSAKYTDVVIETVDTKSYAFTVYNAKGSDGTAIDNTEVAEKAVKMIENGQLFIIKNGVKYNAQGVVVK